MTTIDNVSKRDATLDNVYGDFSKLEPPSNDDPLSRYSKTGGSEYVFFTINSRPSSRARHVLTRLLTPSLQAAGSKGEGLRPGSAPGQTAIGDGQALRIRFETVGQPQLRQQLAEHRWIFRPRRPKDFQTRKRSGVPEGPNHYWSFFVVNTNRGFFQATGT